MSRNYFWDDCYGAGWRTWFLRGCSCGRQYGGAMNFVSGELWSALVEVGTWVAASAFSLAGAGGSGEEGDREL